MDPLAPTAAGRQSQRNELRIKDKDGSQHAYLFFTTNSPMLQPVSGQLTAHFVCTNDMLAGKLIPARTNERFTVKIEGARSPATLSLRQTSQGYIIHQTEKKIPEGEELTCSIQVKSCRGRRNCRVPCVLEAFVDGHRCEGTQPLIVCINKRGETIKAVRKILKASPHPIVPKEEVEALLFKAGLGQRPWNLTGIFNLVYDARFGEAAMMSASEVSGFLEDFDDCEKLLLKILPYLKKAGGEGVFPLVPYAKKPDELLGADRGIVTHEKLRCILSLVLGPKVGDLDRIVESFDLENKNFETIICVEKKRRRSTDHRQVEAKKSIKLQQESEEDFSLPNVAPPSPLAETPLHFTSDSQDFPLPAFTLWDQQDFTLQLTEETEWMDFLSDYFDDECPISV